jgi:hypothetical protein
MRRVSSDGIVVRFNDVSMLRHNTLVRSVSMVKPWPTTVVAPARSVNVTLPRSSLTRPSAVAPVNVPGTASGAARGTPSKVSSCATAPSCTHSR